MATTKPTNAHPGKGGNSYKADRERLLADMENAILTTGSSKKAVGLIMKRHGIPKRTAQDYAARVRKRWRDEAIARGGDRAAMLEEHRNRLLQIYQQSLKDRRLAVAQKVAVTLAQLDGFLTTIRVQGTVEHRVPREQYEQAVAGLEAEGWTPPPKPEA